MQDVLYLVYCNVLLGGWTEYVPLPPCHNPFVLLESQVGTYIPLLLHDTVFLCRAVDDTIYKGTIQQECNMGLLA